LEGEDIKHLLKEHGVNFEEVMEVLYLLVDKTIDKIDNFHRGKKTGISGYSQKKRPPKAVSMHSKRLRFKHHRTIFHPCEIGVNIFFIITSSIKVDAMIRQTLNG
jgi:hypothetical protein